MHALAEVDPSHADRLRALVVVDPETSDQTAAVATRLVDELPIRGEVLTAPETGLAAGWNHGISATTTTHLVRWDAHGRYPRGLISNLLRAGLDRDDVDAYTVIGGPVLLESDAASREADLVSAVDRSMLFSGGAVTYKKDLAKTAVVESDFVARGIYSKAVYNLVGPYRSMPYAGEDTEWASRARRMGVRFLIDPTMTSYHSSRSNLVDFADQKHRNGAASSYMLFRHGQVSGARKLMLLAGLPTLLAAGALNSNLRLLLAGSYATVSAFAARRAGLGIADTPWFVASSVAGHASFMTGGIQGAVAALKGR